MANVISGGDLSNLEAPGYQNQPTYGPILIDGPVTSWSDLGAATAHLDPMTVWSTQPSVRKVVDFIARALASTPLKLYSRDSDNDRSRVTDHPLARILASPDGTNTTAYRFWHRIIVDWLLYDRWCVLKSVSLDTTRRLDLVRVQAQRIAFADDGLGRVTKVWVDGRFKLDPNACLFDAGYAPISGNGTSPMQTLAAILQESREAVEYRRSVWKRGARVPAVIQRPAGAPAWGDTAKERFAAGWRAFAQGGGREGGTPVLEDGMTLMKVDTFSPKDTQDIEGRQFSDGEVASAYHIAPELVGARQGTYSNIDAFRQMLYRDALGPLFVQWEQVLNVCLVTSDLDPTGLLYIEADLDAKLRGSFEEQAAVLSTAVGGPWLTRNEARGRQNLPAMGEDADQLIVPLNVVEGGQASPNDTGSQNTTP